MKIANAIFFLLVSLCSAGSFDHGRNNTSNIQGRISTDSVVVGNLAGAWIFDHDAGGNYWDYSPLGTNNGTTTNAPMWESGHLAFNGTSTTVYANSMVSALSTNPTGAWCAWIRPHITPSGSFDFFLSMGDSGTINYCALYVSTTREFGATCRNPSAIQWSIETDGLMTLNEWIHVAILQDGTAAQVMTNGIHVTAVSRPHTTDNGAWGPDLTAKDNFLMGAFDLNNNGPIQHYDGDISDVRVFNINIGSNAITDIYRRTVDLPH